MTFIALPHHAGRAWARPRRRGVAGTSDGAPGTTRLDVVPPPSRLIRAIDWYQRAHEGQPSPCRFTPSCSAYAREALERHGRRRGLWLTLRRLARCRPLGPSGWDPVPYAPCSPTKDH